MCACGYTENGCTAGKDATMHFTELHKPSILTTIGAEYRIGDLAGAESEVLCWSNTAVHPTLFGPSYFDASMGFAGAGATSNASKATAAATAAAADDPVDD
jgi:hypothetical protein